MQATEKRKKTNKNKKYMLVRYSKMNMLGLFEHHENRLPKQPTSVVVKTGRGLELGHLVGGLAAYKDGNFRLSASQMAEYYENDENQNFEKLGEFVRFGNKEDANEQRHLEQISREEIKVCEDYVRELGLEMKIVDAEHIFGGERIVYYFMADGRVDFRTLVRKLASEYQTRIEMRQIGARDEAQILGDYETCGQQCCCQRFLQALKPVSMRMAKVQKATLDPGKISGYCGRLKCCLRYEDQTYTELKKNLPNKRTCVRTEYGEGRVVDSQIITQLVVVDHGDGKRVAVSVDEIEILPNKRNCRQKPKNGDNNGNNAKANGNSNGAANNANKNNTRNNNGDRKAGKAKNKNGNKANSGR